MNHITYDVLIKTIIALMRNKNVFSYNINGNFDKKEKIDSFNLSWVEEEEIE